VLAGVVALGVFAVVRGLNGYGNGGLLRGDDSLVQWLHTAKYPPSLAYVASELGLAWLLLAALWNARLPAWASEVLTPLGQSALFFYLLHKHLLQGLSYLLELHHRAGLAVTYFMTVVAIALLLPLCRTFHRYKVAHPDGWARFI
jgi:surface polysaccharide O-acyltransferase-like enzyme